MKSSGQPPHFTNEEIEIQVEKWPSLGSSKTFSQLIRSGPLMPSSVCGFSTSIMSGSLGTGLSLLDFCFFLTCCPSIAPHQGRSAQSYSLPSTGKSSPCKPSTSSKTRCSSAATQATKCWRYRVLPGQWGPPGQRNSPEPPRPHGLPELVMVSP